MTADELLEDSGAEDGDEEDEDWVFVGNNVLDELLTGDESQVLIKLERAVRSIEVRFRGWTPQSETSSQVSCLVYQWRAYTNRCRCCFLLTFFRLLTLYRVCCSRELSFVCSRLPCFIFTGDRGCGGPSCYLQCYRS